MPTLTGKLVMSAEQIKAGVDLSGEKATIFLSPQQIAEQLTPAQLEEICVIKDQKKYPKDYSTPLTNLREKITVEIFNKYGNCIIKKSTCDNIAELVFALLSPILSEEEIRKIIFENIRCIVGAENDKFSEIRFNKEVDKLVSALSPQNPWKEMRWREKTSEEEIKKIVLFALDKIGLELKVWKEDYFGYKPEEENVNNLAKAISEAIRKIN